MSQPMIIWCTIVGVLLVAFIFRAVERYYTEGHHNGGKPKHLIEIGKDKDIFFIPGDINEDDDCADL